MTATAVILLTGCSPDIDEQLYAQMQDAWTSYDSAEKASMCEAYEQDTEEVTEIFSNSVPDGDYRETVIRTARSFFDEEC